MFLLKRKQFNFPLYNASKQQMRETNSYGVHLSTAYWKIRTAWETIQKALFHLGLACQYYTPCFFICQVYANDSDATPNAYVTYSLVRDVNNHYLDFTISPVNGTIRTAKQLDREAISEYYLTVKAEDDAVHSQKRFVCYETVVPTEYILLIATCEWKFTAKKLLIRYTE